MDTIAFSTAAAIVPGMKSENDDISLNNGEPYIAQSLRRPVSVSDIGSEGTALYKILGSDLNRRGNIALIDDDLLIYVCGNAVIFEDVKNKQKDYLLCIDDGGIGCVAVHPSRSDFLLPKLPLPAMMSSLDHLLPFMTSSAIIFHFQQHKLVWSC